MLGTGKSSASPGARSVCELLEYIHLHVVELVGTGRRISDTDRIRHLRIVRNPTKRHRYHEDHRMVRSDCGRPPGKFTWHLIPSAASSSRGPIPERISTAGEWNRAGR